MRTCRGHTITRLGSVPVLLAAALLCGCMTTPPHRPVELLARVEALAVLQTLNADLLSHDSATSTLQRWCGEHHLAEPARIVARRVHGPTQSIPDSLRKRLAIADDEPLRYRRVQLMCGEHVLSEADNWYAPNRLTADMNRRLDSSDEPFGKVVLALDFRRRTVSAELLWSPLPDAWEMRTATSSTPLRIPHAVLRHEAILTTPAQLPFSAVIETYTNHVLDFGDWPRYFAADNAAR